MSVVVDGHLFTDDGQMTGADGAAGPAAGAVTLGAWAHQQGSQPYLYDVGASAVPATALIVNNQAFTPEGVAYVTTEAVATVDVHAGTLRLRQDGAVRVSTDAVAADDTLSGGWAKASTGQARVSIT